MFIVVPEESLVFLVVNVGTFCGAQTDVLTTDMLLRFPNICQYDDLQRISTISLIFHTPTSVTWSAIHSFH